MTTPPSGPHTSDPAPRAVGATDWDAVEAAADHWAPTRGGRRVERRWWIIGGIGVALASALAIWFGTSATFGRVHWVYTGHQVVSDTQVDIRFDLRRDPDRAVVCGLEAQDASHTVVGRTQVEVGPSQSSPSRHIESVQTATRAITGYLTTCWYADEAPRLPR